MEPSFERGAVIISIDTEQIWGYTDCLTEAQFDRRYPAAAEAHSKLLARLCSAGISATWFVVGGLALRDSAALRDRRCAGRFAGSRRIPTIEYAPWLWHNQSFVRRLAAARPEQEIGLHGGLTHLIWEDPLVTQDIARTELVEGISALEPFCGRPRSFSYPRNREAYHDLLADHGFQCFRGSPPAMAWRLGRTVPGAVLRALEEWRRSTPPVVRPWESRPGLWNIPASMFLYPIGSARARLVGLRSRIERFTRGVEAAAREHAIFHFCFHPENLAESARGFSLLDGILEKLIERRARGDVEVVTMGGLVARMERKQPYVWQ
jgi:hypothetical protein